LWLYGAVSYMVILNFFSTDAKRLIGRRFDDTTVQADMKHWPFTVVSDGGKPKIQVQYKGEGKTFFPEEISSMVLTKMKETAEAYLGKTVTVLLSQFLPTSMIPRGKPQRILVPLLA